MANSAEKLRPQARTAESKESVSRGTAMKETSEIKAGASEVLTTVESGEAGQEGAVEMGTGEVSEEVKEDKKKSSGGSGKAMTADEIEAIRARLLANLPPQAVMVKQIKKKLYLQERKLNKEFNTYKSKGAKAAYQLNVVVAQWRKVREYFAVLANATFEMVKQLWLKIVHGV